MSVGKLFSSISDSKSYVMYSLHVYVCGRFVDSQASMDSRLTRPSTAGSTRLTRAVCLGRLTRGWVPRRLTKEVARTAITLLPDKSSYYVKGKRLDVVITQRINKLSTLFSLCR